MRKNQIIFIAAIIFSHAVFAQYQFEVLPDRDGSKLLKGIISKEVLLKDSSYAKWYMANLKGFTPNAEAVTALKKNSDTLQLLRSEERRVGKECGIACRSRWSPYH